MPGHPRPVGQEEDGGEAHRRPEEGGGRDVQHGVGQVEPFIRSYKIQIEILHLSIHLKNLSCYDFRSSDIQNWI